MYIITFAGYPVTKRDMTTNENRQRFLMQFAEKENIYTLKEDAPFLFPTIHEANNEWNQQMQMARQLFTKRGTSMLREGVTFRKDQGRLQPIRHKWRHIVSVHTYSTDRWDVKPAESKHISSRMMANSQVLDKANRRAWFMVCDKRTFCHICRHEIQEGVFYLKTGRLGICPQCLLDNATHAQNAMDKMDKQYVDEMLTERFLGKL